MCVKICSNIQSPRSLPSLLLINMSGICVYPTKPKPLFWRSMVIDGEGYLFNFVMLSL
jgi:hypothetical protein